MKHLRLTLILLPCLFLASCSQRENRELGIKFIDSASLYPESFKESILKGNYHFPNGIPVLVKTVDSISNSQIGSFATSEVENDSNWTNWGELKKTKQNCILLLVSRHPQLVQIRFGGNISLEAYKAGLSMGNKYHKMQETFISQGYENGLKEILNALKNELPSALEISWIMKMKKRGAKMVFNELSDLSVPSDDAYTNFIFRPYSNIVTSINFLSHPIVLVIINALLLLILVKMGKLLIKKIFGKRKLTGIILIAWGIISSIFFSIPFWGSIIFLSSFRMEDALFAKYLEIPLLPLSSYPAWFSSYTQIWLAAIIGVIVLAVDFAGIYLGAIGLSYLMNSTREQVEKDIQDNTGEIFNEATGKAFRFAILSLFMPRAISLLILFYYVLKIPESVSNYIKLNKINILQSLFDRSKNGRQQCVYKIVAGRISIRL